MAVGHLFCRQPIFFLKAFAVFFLIVMAVLSGKIIEDLYNSGSLVIDPFYAERIGPCSYDLDIGNVRKKKTGSGFPASEEDERTSLPMQGFLQKYFSGNEGSLLPGQFYIGQGPVVWSPLYMPVVATRSTAARHGVQIEPVGVADIILAPSPLYCSLVTTGTAVTVPPESSLAQMVFMDGPPLSGEEIEQVLASGEVKVAGNNEIFYQRFFPAGSTCDMISLRLGPSAKVYNGRRMKFGEPTGKCFDEIDISKGYTLPGRTFCLASTQAVSLSNEYAGFLRKRHWALGQIHPNAPLIQPGSGGEKGAPQVLEMYFNGDFYLHEGRPIAGLELHRVKQPNGSYSGVYQNQKGVQPAIVH